MGALPKRRISTARKGKRRAPKKVSPPRLVACNNCGQPKKPHQVCPSCGYYRGRQVVKIKIKKGKKKEK